MNLIPHKHISFNFYAVFSQLQPSTSAVDGHASPEQPDGAVVSHALPHAPCFPVPPGIQRMVFQPVDRND